MRFTKPLAVAAVVATLAAGVAGCATGSDDAADATTTTSVQAAAASGPASAGGPGAQVSAASVGSEAELVTLIQEAYGDAGLGLHRGHQPVESTLIEVLGISHEEMHVRMETQGQNLAAVATDLGIDPQTLIDALTESWSPAIDALVEDGTITEAEGDAYRDALEEAFTFRVTWNGQDATPTFAGLGTA